MYEVKAIVRLDRQEDVIAALHAVPDLPGLTISMVEGVGRRHADAVLEPVDFGRATMAKIELVVGEDRLTQVLDASRTNTNSPNASRPSTANSNSSSAPPRSRSTSCRRAARCASSGTSSG